MGYPVPPFISFSEAATILDCSAEQLRYILELGDLTAYALTPAQLPMSNPSEDLFSFPIHYFWDFQKERKLAVHCQICPPFRWRGDLVECKKIIVKDETGEPLSITKDLTISGNDLVLRPDGAICLKMLWWGFTQERIFLNTQQVADYKRDHGENGPGWAIDADYGQPRGTKPTPEQIKERGLALGKQKFEIVAMIDDIHTNGYRLNNLAVGHLFCTQRNESDYAKEQRGKRLRKEIITKRSTPGFAGGT